MAKSLNAYFGISERGSTVSREIVAGIVTFLSMVYILAVQPGIMSAAGMDTGRVFTATALSAGVATLVMAFVGRIPIALASGLGINAYIAFTVCGAMGYKWETALTAVLIEGLLFILLTLTGLRELIVKAIPDVIKKATAVGIGLFIAVVGLNNAGILVTGGGTPIGINPVTSGAPLVAALGLVILVVLYALRVPGSVFLAIIASTLIAIPFGLVPIPEGFSFVSKPPAPYFFDFDFTNVLSIDFVVVFFSLLFVDFFDTISTLAGVAHQGNLLDKDGNIINCKEALLSDAIGTVFGSIFGATTVTSYIESATGVSTGGKTGFASVITGVLFLAALFLSPFFLLIPSAATAPCLIFTGVLMLGSVTGLNFRDIDVALPVFITVLMIPISYSISTGLAWGFLSFTLVKFCTGKMNEITITTWALSLIFLAKIIWVKA
ncbi:MAG: NCS2 family permease [Spirochaetaceae bacterium]|jgi:AGZA family xanthine/uracil permease-like MFS transporter|nr:NCS2 family permease [Spirochaetaceae bacterium]